jgi:hypothetical protein
MINWERLGVRHAMVGLHADRARVPGGWLVLVTLGGNFTAFFYPDPEHIWDGNSLP